MCTANELFIFCAEHANLETVLTDQLDTNRVVSSDLVAPIKFFFSQNIRLWDMNSCFSQTTQIQIKWKHIFIAS